MANSMHPAIDIFTVVYAIKRHFNRLAHDPNLSVRAYATAEATRSSLTVEVVRHITGDSKGVPVCVVEIPRILEIHDSGDTIVTLKDSRVPAITLVSDGTSTVECRRELPTYFDEDINGDALSSDEIAAAMYEQIEPLFG